MKVYEVQSQLGHYQCFEPAEKSNSEALRRLTTFDGAPRKEHWTPPLLHVLYPSLEQPDFWFIPPAAAFAMTPRTIERLGHPIRSAGEYLPLSYKNHALQLLNITQCFDALDTKNCRYPSDSSTGAPVKFAFHTHLIGATLFKIPQTAGSQILCAEWSGDPQEEFKASVEQQGLKGVRFELLWES